MTSKRFWERCMGESRIADDAMYVDEFFEQVTLRANMYECNRLQGIHDTIHAFGGTVIHLWRPRMSIDGCEIGNVARP